jgi:hypothetical protein
MNTYRKTAMSVGVLFIIGTVAGMISLGVLTDPILGAPNYLAGVSANEAKVIMGAFLELVMGVALVGMALAVYPVLRKFSAPLAIGYFGARIVEFMIYISGMDRNVRPQQAQGDVKEAHPYRSKRRKNEHNQ